MVKKRAFTAVGVDGCERGWFYVRVSPVSDFSWGVVDDLNCLFDNSEAQRIFIDVPIGLPDDLTGRRCDKDARAQLERPLKASVFPAPVRAVVTVETYDDAKDLSLKHTGKSISRQTWSIVPRIRHVDSLLRNRGDKDLLKEVHPEVCFWALNGKNSLKSGKKTHDGFWERLAILERACPGIASKLSKFRTGPGVAPDDVLDATVAALTATAPKEALRSLPEKPDKDSCGLPMRMLYTFRQNVRVR